MVNPFLGAFRLTCIGIAVYGVFNGGGFGSIIVAAVLYILLSPFLQR